MKIRTGFVSNSPSGSFILASTLSGDALRDKLEKVFGFTPNVSPYPIKELTPNGIGKRIYEFLNDDGHSISTKEEYLKTIRRTEEEARKEKYHSKALDFLEKGFIIYESGFISHGDDLDQIIGEAAISYEDSELRIKRNNGYDDSLFD
ncbi:MAG: hypothetical protein FWC15_08705 [Fibromonadales bacterium]|nr:hypothetical protein [Fibromonadales bacterium]